MKMLRNVTVMLLAVLLAVAASASPVDKLDGRLQEAMEEADGSELHPVVFLMERRPDAGLLDQALGTLEGQARKQAAWELLEARAWQDQQGLLAELDQAALRGEADEVHPLVLANGVSVWATQTVILAAAERSEVRSVLHDPVTQVLDPLEPGAGTDDLDEIVWSVSRIQAPDVWDIGFTGQSILLAIIDTGVNYNHQDLADHLWDGGTDYPNHGWDYYNNDNNPMDDHSHGTHCAGTAVGDGTAGTQTGVAPDASLMALKVLSGSGNGQYADMWAALDFCLQHGVHVTSASLGWVDLVSDARSTFRSTYDQLAAAGISSAVAAGNERQWSSSYPVPDNIRTPGTVPSPWRHPDETGTGTQGGVITVGATNSSDNFANFSSMGPVTWGSVSPFNDWVYGGGQPGLTSPDVAAPGADITSLDYQNTAGYLHGWDGTSMATPAVAGAIALLYSKNPIIDPVKVDSVLQSTAWDRGDAGKDNDYGAGIIQCMDAINSVVDSAGFIEGYVTDANNDEPLPGVRLTLSDSYRYADTDSSGWFELRIEQGDYVITATKPPYAELVSDTLTVVQDETTTVNLALGVGIIGPDPTELTVTVDSGDETEATLNLINAGSAPATVAFHTQPDSGEIDYLSPIFEWNLSESIGDYKLRGVVEAEGLFYVTGSNGDVNPNKVYVFDQENNPVDTLDQPEGEGGATEIGMYDLAWDGTNLWGGDGTDLVAFDPATGEETARILGPFNPNRALAWDRTNGWLWVSDNFRDIVAIDPADGALMATITSELQTEAMEPAPEDVDGFTLRLLVHENSGQGVLYRANPSSGAIERMHELPDDQGRIIQGFTISRGFQLYYDAGVGLLNASAGDGLKGWQFGQTIPWIVAPEDPVVVPAGQTTPVTLPITPGEMAGDAYDAWIKLNHNTLEEVSWVSITMTVINSAAPLDGRLPTEFALSNPWPNPFNAVTSLRVEVPRPGQVELKVFDLLGREVAHVHRGALDAGRHTFSLDMHGFASGVYFLRMEADGFQAVKKIALMK